MKPFQSGQFLLRLMRHEDREEVTSVLKLRYDFLRRDYDTNLEENGLDDDGYDDYSDSILIIDTTTGTIAGTYRVACPETLKGHPYHAEDQFDMSPFFKNGDRVLELSRAVVHPDYRNGRVIQLLFLAIYHYALEHNCQYFVGLCSFHGHEPEKYKNALALLHKEYLFDRYPIKAVSHVFPLTYIKDENINYDEVKKEMPGLLRMYLSLGHRIATEGSVDVEFNSCDVMVIMGIDTINPQYLKWMTKDNA